MNDRGLMHWQTLQAAEEADRFGFTDLEAAAYAYAEAYRHFASALSCCLPMEFTKQLSEQVKQCEADLLKEAEAFFDNVYAGATE